jgi:hypothetical protein
MEKIRHYPFSSREFDINLYIRVKNREELQLYSAEPALQKNQIINLPKYTQCFSLNCCSIRELCAICAHDFIDMVCQNIVQAWSFLN